MTETVNELTQQYLVGGLEHGFYDFPETVGNFIIPTDEVHHFFRGVDQPPTSNYIIYIYNPYHPYKSPLLMGKFTTSTTNHICDTLDILVISQVFFPDFTKNCSGFRQKYHWTLWAAPLSFRGAANVPRLRIQRETLRDGLIWMGCSWVLTKKNDDFNGNYPAKWWFDGILVGF